MLFLTVLLLLSLGIAGRPRNFIVIVADDMGVGDLQNNGAVGVQTPNLNAMENEGVKLTQFTASPLCSPTRASLYTGQAPPRTGTYTNMPNHSTSISPIPLDIFWRVFYPGSSGCPISTAKFIPQYLKEHNPDYWAGMVGKWHLGHQPVQGCLPTRRGFDSFEGIPYSHEESFPTLLGNAYIPPYYPFPPLPLYRNETIVKQPVDFKDLEGISRNRILSDLQWLAKTKRPFYYDYSFGLPHYPVYNSQDFVNQSQRNNSYGDAIQEIDATVGMILGAVRSNSFLRKNTVVIFLSDNGAWVHPGSGIPGDPITYPDQGGDTCGRTGEKGDTYEGGTRVPAIFWSSDPIFPPAISSTPVTINDLLPTILELADIPLPGDRVLDGYSLVPLLTGDNTTSPHLYIPYWRESLLYAIRYGPFKCEFFTRTGFGTDPPLAHTPCLLYNVEQLKLEDSSTLINGTKCAGLMGATTCDDIIAVMNASYAAEIARMVFAPPQYELINITYTPCCSAPNSLTQASWAAALALYGPNVSQTMWEALNCTC